MYQYELIEIYMQTKGYTQAKQAAMDLGIDASQITRFKDGKRKIDEETAIYIAERCALDVEEVLLKLRAEQAKSDKEKAIWAGMIKKYKTSAQEHVSDFLASLKANLINFA